jgi:hypothetical protein
MRNIAIIVFLFSSIGCNNSQENSSVAEKMNQVERENFSEYLSTIPNPKDTVRELSNYISKGHGHTLETAYLVDRVFDSLLSPSKDTRLYYFTVSVSALRDMAMFDSNFNSNLCQRIKADPVEIIQLINGCDTSTVKDLAWGIDNYFSSHVKAPKQSAEIINLLSQTSTRLDSQSVANIKYLTSIFNLLHVNQ